MVLGFPSNDFGGQEPGTEEEIKTFCKTKYAVTFPPFSKITVKGSQKHPLYDFLTSESANPQHGGEITRNFNKFLVDKQGNVIGRFGTQTVPEDPQVVASIQKALAEKQDSQARVPFARRHATTRASSDHSLARRVGLSLAENSLELS